MRAEHLDSLLSNDVIKNEQNDVFNGVVADILVYINDRFLIRFLLLYVHKPRYTVPFVIWIFGEWMKSIAAIEWGKKDDGIYIWPPLCTENTLTWTKC